jgi:hypothetical protein
MGPVMMSVAQGRTRSDVCRNGKTRKRQFVYSWTTNLNVETEGKACFLLRLHEVLRYTMGGPSISSLEPAAIHAPFRIQIDVGVRRDASKPLFNRVKKPARRWQVQACIQLLTLNSHIQVIKIRSCGFRIKA